MTADHCIAAAFLAMAAVAIWANLRPQNGGRK